MNLSNEWKRVLTAYEVGFRILEDGSILSHTGNTVSGYIRKGRRYISIRQDGKPTNAAVQKLQAYQLFGDAALKEDIVVRHLDGNPLNNAAENIAIGTQQDNSLDRKPLDRKQQAKHAAKSVRKLSEQQALELRKDRQEGFTYSQLVEKYGIAKSTVSYIVNNKTY